MSDGEPRSAAMTGKKTAKTARKTPTRSPKRSRSDAAARAVSRTDKADSNAAVLAKIALLPAPFRAVGERLHLLITNCSPELTPIVWYGMPGYRKDGKVVCFFRADKKYMTFGFTQDANLAREDGAAHQLIESAWYFTALDDASEAKLSAIIRKAAS